MWIILVEIRVYIYVDAQVMEGSLTKFCTSPSFPWEIFSRGLSHLLTAFRCYFLPSKAIAGPQTKGGGHWRPWPPHFLQNNRAFFKIFCYECPPPPPLSNLCRSPRIEHCLLHLRTKNRESDFQLLRLYIKETLSVRLCRLKMCR